MQKGRRKISFTSNAWEDYTYFQGQDRKTLKRINKLIESSLRTPFEGIGKPEALVGNLSGCLSRRIDETHRLVYKVDDENIYIIACRYYYS